MKTCDFNNNFIKAQVKRRTSHVPNLMLMSKFYCSISFALRSAHVKFDVWPGPNLPLTSIVPSCLQVIKSVIKTTVVFRTVIHLVTYFYPNTQTKSVPGFGCTRGHQVTNRKSSVTRTPTSSRLPSLTGVAPQNWSCMDTYSARVINIKWLLHNQQNSFGVWDPKKLSVARGDRNNCIKV